MKTTAEKSTTTATRPPTLLPKRGRDSFVPSSPALQAKLTVNTPGDEFEREADQTADTLMRRGSARAGEREEPSIRKQEAPPEDEIQRQCSDCEKKEETPVHTVQREASGDGDGGTTAPAIVGEVISSGGSSLDGATRTHMENHFGADFSQVRVHNDGRAHTSARAISAHAYTYGNHIAFAEGQYRPTTQSGRHLLAHELTHVVQQRPLVQRLLGTQNAAADRLLSNRPAAPAPAPTFQPPAPVPGAAPAPITPDAPAPIDQAGTDILPLEDELPTAEVPTGGEAPEEINIEPLMPPAPEEMNPEAQERLGQSQRRARLAAGNNADMPAATEMTQEAREGVNEPTQETEARASGELAGTLSQRPAPSPEIETLCENIQRIIREKRPPDEDSLLQADPEEAANEAGSQLNDNVEGDVDRVEGQYDQLDENPTGTPEQVGQPVEAPPNVVGVPEVDAAGAAPDPLTEEEVSLEADVAASAQRMEEAGMQTPAAQAVQDGPIAEARAAHGELEETAAEDPATVLAEQDAALSNARADMETLQAQALEALRLSRSRSVSGSSAQQTAMVGSEEQQRAELGRQAREIFTGAQSQVNLLLGPLSRTAMEMWERGKDRIATEFEQHLARVQRWVDDRHSGFGGGLVELWDDLTGLPDWVTDEYDDAERRFGDSICALIREISIYVNGVILTCEELIDNANREIDTLFDNAPEELREWAEGQRADFQQRLDGLREQVTTTQQNFNRDLADRAAQAVQEVRERVHALREAAKGLLSRLADALMEFLEDPLRAIINGLLRLVGIDPAAFWALVARIEQVISDIVDDPIGFASNLLSAIGAGFQRFFDNFVTHLFEGLVEWLFSGLGAVGVEIPRELSLSSIMTFFLQLMGITWERIRRLLARHIGEENVALLEQAYQIISDLIELGPAGIFELIEDQLDPRHILDTIIQMAVDFIKETLITQATVRIIGLFNPVGAIAQAIEAIYKVLKWIFQNAARIFSLVETVVNGMADIIAGNIAGMTVAVEQALKRLLVPVIDFIAEFMSMGDLPERVADAVKGLQTWVEGILDRVIGWLAGQARALLRSLGIGEDEEEEDGNLTDREVGDRVNFRGGNEMHHLWVQVNGNQLEVMVASDAPLSLSNRLSQWEGRVGDLPQEQQSPATGLITTVRNQYNTVKAEGEQSQQAIDQAQQDPTPQNVAQAQEEDNQVEQAQRAMTPELGQLFDLFEGGVPFQPAVQTVHVSDAAYTLGIAEDNNHHLQVQWEGDEIARQLARVVNGPLGTAHHREGRSIITNIVTQISPRKNEIRAIKVQNDRIPSAIASQMNGWLNELAEGLRMLAPIMARNLQQLLTSPPVVNIAVSAVEFAQQLGTSQVIHAEYDRQLRLQQEGINRLSVDQWIVNRNAYSLDDQLFLRLDADQRQAVLRDLHSRAEAAEGRARSKKQQFTDAIEEIEQAILEQNLSDPTYSPDFSDISLVTNRFGNEGNWRSKRRSEVNSILQELRQAAVTWQGVFDSAAVLHNADQIAGGFGIIPDITRVPRPSSGQDATAWNAYLQQLRQYVGSSNVNSSIGSLWRTNIVGLETEVRSKYATPAWPVWKMNVTLRRI